MEGGTIVEGKDYNCTSKPWSCSDQGEDITETLTYNLSSNVVLLLVVVVAIHTVTSNRDIDIRNELSKMNTNLCLSVLG